MKIVTDSGADLIFPQSTLDLLDYETVPLTVTLDNKSYREDIDITTEEFYNLLENTKSLPTTSQPRRAMQGPKAVDLWTAAPWLISNPTIGDAKRPDIFHVGQ